MNEENYFLNNHLAQTTPYNMGIKVSRAEGVYIYDVEEKKYMDLISGLGVSSLGHGNRKVIDAINEQTEKYLHVMVYGEYEQSPQMGLAKKLSSLLPENLNTSYFLNSGTEANEAALKLAKRATGRSKIISFKGAYHGSTHGSLSVSGNEEKKQAFRPLLPEVDFIELNIIKDLDRIDEKCACVILETIQGDAGIRIPNAEYMLQLRERCTAKGVLLILDEIQAGLGRTGKFSAFEHFQIIPDILTLGKALGAGLPIGAMVTSKEWMSKFTHNPVLGHITTFGGNPVICSAALAGLSVLEESNHIDQVEAKADYFYDLIKDHPKIKEIRYKGLFYAVELENEALVEKLVFACKDKGVLLFWFLSCKNAFRMAPPLSITEMELKSAANIILETLSEI